MSDQQRVLEWTVDSFTCSDAAHFWKPVLVLAFGDALIKMLNQLAMSVKSFFGKRMFLNEIQSVNCFFGTICSDNQWVRPNCITTIGRVREGHWWLILRLKDVFNLLDLIVEKFVNLFRSFLLNEVHDSGSTCKHIEVLQHFNSVFNCCNVLECQRNCCCVNYLNPFNIFFKCLTVVFMPLGNFNIQNVVLEILNLTESSFKILLLVK